MKTSETVLQEKVRRLAYTLFELAKMNLQRYKSLLPTSFLISPNGEARIIGCEFTSPESKGAVMRCLSEKAREEGTHALLLLGEAWAYKEGESSKSECITLIVTQRGSQRWEIVQPFVSKAGCITFLGEKVEHHDIHCGLIPEWEL